MTTEEQKKLEKDLGFNIDYFTAGNEKTNRKAAQNIASRINAACNKPNHLLFAYREAALRSHPSATPSSACQKYVLGLKKEYLISKGCVLKKGKGKGYVNTNTVGGSSNDPFESLLNPPLTPKERRRLRKEKMRRKRTPVSSASRSQFKPEAAKEPTLAQTFAFIRNQQSSLRNKPRLG